MALDASCMPDKFLYVVPRLTKHTCQDELPDFLKAMWADAEKHPLGKRARETQIINEAAFECNAALHN